MNYYLITKSRIHHKLTQDQRDIIMADDFSEMKLGDGYVGLNSIAELVNEDKYFEAYPDKRPPENRDNLNAEYRKIDQVRKPTKMAMDLMKKGFIQQRVYGNSSYTREQELLDFATPRMTKEEAEKELIHFNKFV